MRWLLVLVVLLTCSCKKTVEKVAESMITDLIINYDWYVHSFKINGKDSTSLFDNYRFDFQKNDKVVAYVNNQSFTGNWVANVNALTIASAFNEELKPLQLLTNTWSILGTTTTSVRASTIVGNNNYQMTLYRIN
ncbi:hypothetical protein [Gynurincola endophyticus]|jgi:hypothetical protein|uniref:hypothetical protein n=1 Tax=Gynurincola endophyticus TaxID=2479004 RepID=UPI000F8D84E2|nr:hypothetical protein [Gynurincola endophyticus]